MELKVATINDLQTIINIETQCFPLQEAASEQSLKERLETYHQGYLLAFYQHRCIGYVGGLRSNQKILKDEMYEDVSLHLDEGLYQMIFSVCILPEYQGHGYAREMLNGYIDYCFKKGVKGIVLTCKDHLLPFYQSCGFHHLGVSQSTHGGAIWNDMLLEFSKHHFLACDFDGTLLQHQGNQAYIKQEDKEAIIHFQNEGHHFGICTGRNLADLLKQSEDVHFDFYILNSGALILDKNQKIIQNNTLPLNIVKEVITSFQEELCWTIVCHDHNYIYHRPDDFAYEISEIQSLEELQYDVESFSVHTFDDKEKAKDILEKIQRHFDSYLSAYQNEGNVDIVAKGCSKGKAIDFIRNYYHLDSQHIHGIGDSYNDISMLDACTQSFTFIHSDPSVQLHATHIVKSVKECIKIIENNQ